MKVTANDDVDNVMVDFCCSLSGKVFGYMAQIYLHNDNFADAWYVLFVVKLCKKQC